ncbi:hypothetical protein H0W26_04895 [Candidatus Dependentiae bacterium]|nr:hypothetical protein [Candidatus Dependentiae bacterium]
MKSLLILTVLTLGLGAELLACGCGVVRKAVTPFKQGVQQPVATVVR